MSKEEALLLRSDLLQLAKGLELQRSAVLSIVARLEKQHDINKGEKNGRSKSFTGDIQQESSEDLKLPSNEVFSS